MSKLDVLSKVLLIGDNPSKYLEIAVAIGNLDLIALVARKAPYRCTGGILHIAVAEYAAKYDRVDVIQKYVSYGDRIADFTRTWDRTDLYRDYIDSISVLYEVAARYDSIGALHALYQMNHPLNVMAARAAINYDCIDAIQFIVDKIKQEDDRAMILNYAVECRKYEVCNTLHKMGVRTHRWSEEALEAFTVL